jgi:Phage integrase, N-terminal SAM-like domain
MGLHRFYSRNGFSTKKAAQEALSAELARFHSGAFVEPSKLTVEAFLVEQWLPAVQGRLRPSTRANYQTNLQVHIIPALGSLKLQRLTAPHRRLLQPAPRRRPTRRQGLGTQDRPQHPRAAPPGAQGCGPLGLRASQPRPVLGDHPFVGKSPQARGRHGPGDLHSESCCSSTQVKDLEGCLAAVRPNPS